jgi:hypothetical protein
MKEAWWPNMSITCWGMLVRSCDRRETLHLGVERDLLPSQVAQQRAHPLAHFADIPLLLFVQTVRLLECSKTDAQIPLQERECIVRRDDALVLIDHLVRQAGAGNRVAHR